MFRFFIEFIFIVMAIESRLFNLRYELYYLIVFPFV